MERLAHACCSRSYRFLRQIVLAVRLATHGNTCDPGQNTQHAVTMYTSITTQMQ